MFIPTGATREFLAGRLFLLIIASLALVGGACSDSASRAPSVSDIAVFGFGARRACSYLTLYFNVASGQPSSMPQEQCERVTTEIHERHLSADDRRLYGRFARSSAAAKLAAYLTSQDSTSATIPGACSAQQFKPLRRIAVIVIREMRNSLPDLFPHDSGGVGFGVEAVVVGLSPLCDRLSMQELVQTADIVDSDATERMAAAAAESFRWAAKAAGGDAADR